MTRKMRKMIPIIWLLNSISTFAAPLEADVSHLTCAQARPTLEDLNHPLSDFKLDPDQNTRWLHTDSPHPVGVVLVIHGLDIKPSKMDSIGRLLTRAGFEVLRVALSGQRGSLEEMRQVSCDEWVRETLLSY